MITIREPFFSAGKKFGWPGKPIGLGISMYELQGNGILELTVGDSKVVWQIDKEKARDFVSTYKSWHIAKNTRLGVIAWYEFTKSQE